MTCRKIHEVTQSDLFHTYKVYIICVVIRRRTNSYWSTLLSTQTFIWCLQVFLSVPHINLQTYKYTAGQDDRILSAIPLREEPINDNSSFYGSKRRCKGSPYFESDRRTTVKNKTIFMYYFGGKFKNFFQILIREKYYKGHWGFTFLSNYKCDRLSTKVPFFVMHREPKNSIPSSELSWNRQIPYLDPIIQWVPSKGPFRSIVEVFKSEDSSHGEVR